MAACELNDIRIAVPNQIGRRNFFKNDGIGSIFLSDDKSHLHRCTGPQRKRSRSLVRGDIPSEEIDEYSFHRTALIGCDRYYSTGPKRLDDFPNRHPHRYHAIPQ